MAAKSIAETYKNISKMFVSHKMKTLFYRGMLFIKPEFLKLVNKAWIRDAGIVYLFEIFDSL